jgi:dUTP pyrophosphatase
MRIEYCGREPRKAHDLDAAYDLTTSINMPRVIKPGRSETIPLGFRILVPEGHVALVVPRSGLAFRHGITLLNSPGVIDPGYTGEVMARLVNLGDKPYTVAPGDRVAQLLLVKCKQAEWVWREREHFDAAGAERGAGGFGSTGR